MNNDEFRVEIDLGGPDHGLSLGDRLRSHDLDDEARERLGQSVIVTRDGSHLFIYAGTLESAGEAERVAAELIREDGLEASISVNRWHPVAGAWRDASEPLPESEEARAAELRTRAAAEAPQERLPMPGFVLLGSYKPEFMRDLGL